MVAPCAGAWIEIILRPMDGIITWSLPVRERGLKYPTGTLGDYIPRSLPVRERGLKYPLHGGTQLCDSRSLYGSVD